MSRRTCDARVEAYAVDLRKAISLFLPRSGLPLIAGDDRLGWTPRLLVIAALLVSWDASAWITDAFAAARKVVGLICRAAHRRQPGDTYHGFMRTLAARTRGLLAVVAPALRGHVESLARRNRCWQVPGGGGGGEPDGWTLFGVDGSRDACPRTKSNREKFGKSGRDKSGPQQFVTTVFHVGSGLAWDFRTGGARASERSHLLEMLDTLPGGPCTMLLADAGFVGYDFFRSIAGSGRRFLIRVGANVKLITELGYAFREHAGVVYLWPGDAQRDGLPPVILRHVTLVDGRNRRMHLLTNVMDAADMSDAEANEMYGKRWGIELMYRSLKQTLGKRKMRCADAENAEAELGWAMVSLWLLGLMTASAVADAGGQAGRWSPAAGLRAVRRAMTGGPARRRANPPSLLAGLAQARKDRYKREGSKTSADWPHKKREKPPGDPKARKATAAEIKLAADLRATKVAA